MSCPARDDPVEDPYYEAAAWYLEAIRAPDAWAAGYTGAGVQILVNDNGVDNTHPDLAKLDVANSCDVYAPSGWDAHGTVCASLAAGDANSHCGVGAAAARRARIRSRFAACVSGCGDAREAPAFPLQGPADASDPLYLDGTTAM